MTFISGPRGRGALGDVRQERHLARALDRLRDLNLVSPAGAGDAPAPDLPLLRDVAAELGDVLVVDVRDLVLAEEAVPALDRPGRATRTLPLCLCSLAWCHALS
jgi:hypothetical protein